MRIRAVFFDMGGTIQTYGTDHGLRLEATPGLRRLLTGAGIDLPLDDEQLEALVSNGLERYKHWAIESLVELPPCSVWQQYIFRDVAVDPAKLEPVAEELAFYVETHFYRRALRPEVPGVLEAIRNMGLKIGLVSNVNSLQQVPANLDEYGIRHYFDPIVLSSEYGRRKPDPSIFHYAARLASVPTSECAYIGDRIARDIEGAHRTGFGLAIQIQHDFEHGEVDEGAEPDAVVTSMSEVLDILRSRSGANGEPPGKVRAILFDAGDILYYRPHRGQCFQAFLQEMSIEVAEGHAIDKESFRQQAYQGQIDQDQYQEAILRMYGISDPELMELGKHALRDDENNVEFFEGIPETLVALKQKGYLLGIVTDTANPIHAKLNWFERGGFGNVWDSIISSRELGMRKPDPRIYGAALEQLGVQAEQAVFVGHRTLELEGARNACLRTIAFNYDADAKADYYIERFPDLLTVPLFIPEASSA